MISYCEFYDEGLELCLCPFVSSQWSVVSGPVAVLRTRGKTSSTDNATDY